MVPSLNTLCDFNGLNTCQFALVYAPFEKKAHLSAVALHVDEALVVEIHHLFSRAQEKGKCVLCGSNN